MANSMWLTKKFNYLQSTTKGEHFDLIHTLQAATVTDYFAQILSNTFWKHYLK